MTPLAVSPLGAETLDRADGDPEIARATLADLRIVNAACGGRQAAAHGLHELLARRPRAGELVLLDVGAGAGDILHHLVTVGGRRGVRVRPVALDFHRTAARMCRSSGLPAVVADAGALPLRPGGVDIVLASQFLHHLDRGAARAAVRDLSRVARVGVIVADLRRSRLALAGIRVLAWILRLHPATCRDGVVSIRRGYRRAELEQLLAEAGVRGTVRRRPGFRLVAWWETAGAHG